MKIFAALREEQLCSKTWETSVSRLNQTLITSWSTGHVQHGRIHCSGPAETISFLFIPTEYIITWPLTFTQPGQFTLTPGVNLDHWVSVRHQDEPPARDKLGLERTLQMHYGMHSSDRSLWNNNYSQATGDAQLVSPPRSPPPPPVRPPEPEPTA